MVDCHLLKGGGRFAGVGSHTSESLLTPFHANARLAASGRGGLDFAGAFGTKGRDGPVGGTGCCWARIEFDP